MTDASNYKVVDATYAASFAAQEAIKALAAGRPGIARRHVQAAHTAAKSATMAAGEVVTSDTRYMAATNAAMYAADLAGAAATVALELFSALGRRAPSAAVNEHVQATLRHANEAADAASTCAYWANRRRFDGADAAWRRATDAHARTVAAAARAVAAIEAESGPLRKSRAGRGAAR